MSRRIAGILAVVGLSASCGSEEIAGNRGILPITPAVATVSSSGLITAIAAGLVRVTAVSEGRTGAATVTSVR